MSFDNSRITFDPWNDYSGVVMEQGRVQSDADWNEWLAQQQRRVQAGTLDTVGQAIYPPTTPFAFQITPSTTGGSVTIGRGRMYVDGILVENHGDPTKATWDPSLAEMSGSPQPPPASDAFPVPFESQPYNQGGTFPATAGDYLVYLDVWRQPISYIEEPTLIDPAIGVDTTGRLKVEWQVRAMPVASGTTCASAAPQWPSSAGQLSNATVASAPSGPCCLTTGSGYTGVENQFYRVEIHAAGTPGGTGATFKWSRENASVQTTITAVAPGTNTAGGPASVLTVASLGRDQVLGFSAGNWVEITNETNDNACQPGTLYQIDSVDVASLAITLTSQLPSGFSVTPTATNAYTRLIRWDQSGKVYKSDGKTLWCDLDVIGSGPLENGFYGIPVPTDGSQLILESGIVVGFGLSPSSGSYLAMDYWNFSARTATGMIDQLTNAAPRGMHHHYAMLSIATVGSTGTVTAATDCRTKWSCSGTSAGGCCTCTVGVGGTYSTIAAAILALPDSGGEICILPGDYYENVVLSSKQNVVIHGCEWQTHVFSAALNPAAGGAASGGTAPASSSGLTAVFTIVDCENIELHSFSVTAADGEVGILLDRMPPLPSPGGTSVELLVAKGGDAGIILEDLILEASTMPALIAVSVAGLKVAENQIFMKDVVSLWAAVYLSGEEMYFVRNWVGLGTAQLATPTPPPAPPPAAAPARAPAAARLTAKQKAAMTSAAAKPELSETVLSSQPTLAQKAPGGIQIAGPSNNVFVLENNIVGGTRNGITLGNFVILDSTGSDTGTLTGVLWQTEDPCSKTGSGQIPGTTGSGTTVNQIGAGGLIQNLHIGRNRIHEMGMAGIGVIGFWNLRDTPEIISIVNLSIVANEIAHTLMRPMSPYIVGASGFAYGAISLADVENLVIRDNAITDFGATPGADVCGIFVLHGEMVEISRNQIRETRDWNADSIVGVTTSNQTRAGILMFLVTPPTLEGSAWRSSLGAQKIDWTLFTSNELQRENPIYEPGLPALRIQENVVRVAIGLALAAFGYGPFAISNNHFGSGGPVNLTTTRQITSEFAAPSKDSASYEAALLVEVLNLGLAIEDVNQGNGFAALYERSDDAELGATRNLANASSGAVLFTGNMCQLEAWASGVKGLCSVAILSFDHVLFSSNHLWVDAPPITALVDAFLLGVTLQMCDNRLQECQYYPVIFSGVSVGIANVTAHNIATYCLAVKAPPIYCINAPNVILMRLLCPPPKTGTKAAAAAGTKP